MKDEEGCLAAKCREIAIFWTTWRIPNVVHFQMRIDGLGVGNLNLRRQDVSQRGHADTKEAKEQAERPHGDSNSSENIDDLQADKKRLRHYLERTLDSIAYHKELMEKYIGQFDDFSMEQVKLHEEDMKAWQDTLKKIRPRLQKVERKIIAIYSRDERPKKGEDVQKE